VKWIVLAAALLFSSTTLHAQSTTTYVGTIKDLTGATVTSGRITFTLNEPSGGSNPGTGSFVATTVSCLINASGSPVSSSDGASPCVITNNSALTPPGTSYTLCRQSYNVPPGSCFVTYANGGTVDISALVQTPTTQPSYGVASTTASNTWSQPQTFAGGITGSVKFSGPVTAGSINTTIYVAPGKGTLSAALAANPGGGVEFKLGCGTYTDNVSFASSSNWIHGGGRFCTVLQPNSSSAPLVNIHPASPGAALWYNSISDLTMQNPKAYAIDGLQLNNLANPAPHNDFNHFWNLYIVGFQNNISILGGNLANTFDNIGVWNAIANNVNVNTTQPVNSLTFHMLTNFSAGGYGVYAKVSSAVAWDFDSPDVEDNGANILTSNCAGMYFNSGSGTFETINIHGAGYFEANCSGGDANAADIRITGATTLGLTVQGAYFSHAAGGNYGCAVFADATTGSAFIRDNVALKPRSTCGTDYKIKNSDTTTGYSGYFIGPNTYLNTGNTEYSFTGTGPMSYLGQALNGVTYFPDGISIAPNHYKVGNGEAITEDGAGGYNFGTNTSPTNCYRFYNGAAGGTLVGQIDCSGNYKNAHGTILSSALTGDHGNSTQLQLSDGTGTSGNLAKFDGNGNITNGVAPVLAASLTTTPGTSDNVTVTGMTSSGHCSLTASNASAATNVATTYISAKTTNHITVTHTATASMTYDVICTPY
jgi:hypothetical protein